MNDAHTHTPDQTPNTSHEDAPRRDERLGSQDPAVLIMADRQEFPGTITNMSMGGMLFEAEERLPEVAEGSQLSVRLNLYGRPSEFLCLTAYQKDNQIGLQRQR